MRYRAPTKTCSFRGLSQGRPLAACSPGFTLIELILVMTILIVAVSVTAPALANFFRGRSLDSEARRLLALTRAGQARAVSEGIPVELWIDSGNRKYGLEAEPSYEPTDSKAQEFELGKDIQLEAVNTAPSLSPSSSSFTSRPASSTLAPLAVRPVLSRHPELPRIRFLPDGSIAETSPQKLRLTDRDGFSIWLVQSRNGLRYELSTRGN